jgi:serine/threonine-protein kinase HipA
MFKINNRMRQALIKYNNITAGILTETNDGEYLFAYMPEYIEQHVYDCITLTMPVNETIYKDYRLFPFFEGLIPEGWLLNIASKNWRINTNDRMGLLLACCQNCIGAVSVHEIKGGVDE